MPNPNTTSHGRAFTSLHRHRHRRNPSKPSKKPDPNPNPPRPTTYMRSTIHTISSILRYSPWSTAQSQLHSLPIKWDSFTVNQVLKTHPPMQKSWLFFNWASTHLPKFKHDKFTYTTMLDIFGEAGRIESLWHLLEQMVGSGVEVDGVTYTSIMHWLAKAGDLEGAVRVWEEMRRKLGVGLTVVSYTAFMKILFNGGREEEAGRVYREMIEVGLKPNCRTYTVLMEYLAGRGKFKAVLEIMSKMLEVGIPPDKATCNILVQKCSLAGNTSAMTHMLQYMKDNSIVLRRPVFLEAIKAFKTSGEIDHLLREVNPHLAYEGIEEEDDYEPTPNDTSSLIDREIVINLLARRNFVALEYILDGMINKEIQLDSKLISAIVLANCVNNRASGALLTFQYSLKTNKKLDRSAYISLLGLFIRVNSIPLILEIVDEMVKAGVDFGTYLVSLLIHRLGCAGLSAFAAKIFDSFPTEHNIVTYTSLISAFFQDGDIDKGLEVYSRMKSRGISVSYGTYEVMIVGLVKVGRFRDAEIYRKEKRRLQWRNYSVESLSDEEILCNCLFDGV